MSLADATQSMDLGNGVGADTDEHRWNQYKISGPNRIFIGHKITKTNKQFNSTQ